jgi:protein SSD1
MNPNFAMQNPMGQFGNMGLNMGLDGQPQGIPRGHGRRHSVNVVNKSASQGNPGSISFGNPFGEANGFDDGFVPPAAGFGGHSRQASRADSSWRISTLGFCIVLNVV